MVYGTGYAYRRGSATRGIPRRRRTALAATPVFNPRVGYTYALRDRARDGRMVAAVLRRRAIPSGLLGPLPVLRHRPAPTSIARGSSPPRRRAPSKSPAKRHDHEAATAAAPPAFNAAAATRRMRTPGPQVPIRHMGPRARLRHVDDHQRGCRERGPVPAAQRPRRPTSPPTSITRAWQRTAAGIRRSAEQQHVRRCRRQGLSQAPRRLAAAFAGRLDARPAPPPAVVAQAHARASVDPGMQAGSFGMSNATRFTGQPATAGAGAMPATAVTAARSAATAASARSTTPTTTRCSTTSSTSPPTAAGGATACISAESAGAGGSGEIDGTTLRATRFGAISRFGAALRAHTAPCARSSAIRSRV